MYLTGVKKATILLISMNIEKAKKVLKNLSKLEIEQIAKCMFNMGAISNKMINHVLLEFNQISKLKNDSHIISKQYIINLFDKVLGEKNTLVLFNQVNYQKEIINNICYLNTVDSKKLADLIKLEHPQIIAALLTYLDKKQSVNILSHFSDELSLNVILRIAKCKVLTNFGIYELKVIVNNLLKHFNHPLRNDAGINMVIRLLKLMKCNKEKKIISKILTIDSKLAKKIKIEMFELSDLIGLCREDIQKIVNLVSLNELSIVMNTLDTIIQEKIFNSISKDDVDSLKKLCSSNSSLSVNLVKSTQNKLLNIIKEFLINNDCLKNIKDE